MLTDVEAIIHDGGKPNQAAIRDITARGLQAMGLDAGSMGRKVACDQSFIREGVFWPGWTALPTSAAFWQAAIV
jgi:carbamate kinase